jgi:hypothetical protein
VTKLSTQTAQKRPLESLAGCKAAAHHDLVRHGPPRLAVDHEDDGARPTPAKGRESR